MKTVKTLCVLMAGILAGCAGPARNTEPLLAELQAINQRLEKIEKQLAAQAAPKKETKKSASRHQSNGPDGEKLGAIEFPESPTPEALREYVSQVVEATMGQKHFSARDPQVEMLARLGEENIDILLDFARHQGAAASYYARLAVFRLATENSKARILEELGRNRHLVQAVIDHGWEAEARDTLLAGLQDRQEQIPLAWVQAISNLRDPATYDELLAHFVKGPYRYQTYEAIKDLPGIRLREAIPQAWESARYVYDDYERNMMATVAVGCGEEEALRLLMESLDRKDKYSPNARQAILLHTEATGTDREIAQWYEAGKDRLYFDTASRRFRAQ